MFWILQFVDAILLVYYVKFSNGFVKKIVADSNLIALTSSIDFKTTDDEILSVKMFYVYNVSKPWATFIKIMTLW